MDDLSEGLGRVTAELEYTEGLVLALPDGVDDERSDLALSLARANGQVRLVHTLYRLGSYSVDATVAVLVAAESIVTATRDRLAELVPAPLA
ncbi:hypothetical protein [Curtobacterium phage Penoan]|nr:hypothetical protein [Curtobacterium phage Penoan]